MKPWSEIWSEIFRLPQGTPEPVVAALLTLIVTLGVVLPSAGVLAWVERKLGADFQARVGPNRAGWLGSLQPISDFLKLLQKKEIPNGNQNSLGWTLIYTAALYSTLAVLPLGSHFVMVDTDLSAFIPFWSILVLALGALFLGLNQQSVPGWLGGMRVAAQTLSGIFPALISLFTVSLRAGGYRWSGFAGAQQFSPHQWAAFDNPFQLLAAVLFVISGLVILGIPPMDSSTAQSDLQGGVSRSLSGRSLSLYRFGQFYGFFFWAVIAVVLFFGAWNIPTGLQEKLAQEEHFFLQQILETGFLLLKVFLLILSVQWIARVNPKNRVDQTTDFAWRVLSPLSLFALIGASLWTAWGAM